MRATAIEELETANGSKEYVLTPVRDPLDLHLNETPTTLNEKSMNLNVNVNVNLNLNLDLDLDLDLNLNVNLNLNLILDLYGSGLRLSLIHI